MVCRLHSLSSFLDAALNAFTEEEAIWQHHGGAATVLEQVHDQHQEQIGGFPGAEGGGEVGFDAVFFHSAERRVGDDALDPLARPPVDQGASRVLSCLIWLGTSMPCSTMLVVASRCGSGFFSTPKMLACRIASSSAVRT